VDALPPSVQLLTAALDLKLVTLLRGAMRSADIASGRMEPVSQLGPAPTPPPPAGLHPEPVIEPRLHFHPTPRFEPRPVIHLAARVEQPAPINLPTPVEVDPPACGCDTGGKTPSLLPPWSIMPWQNPVMPRPKVKVVQYRPDIISKGSLLDFFV